MKWHTNMIHFFSYWFWVLKLRFICRTLPLLLFIFEMFLTLLEYISGKLKWRSGRGNIFFFLFFFFIAMVMTIVLSFHGSPPMSQWSLAHFPVYFLLIFYVVFFCLFVCFLAFASPFEFYFYFLMFFKDFNLKGWFPFNAYRCFRANTLHCGMGWAAEVWRWWGEVATCSRCLVFLVFIIDVQLGFLLRPWPNVNLEQCGKNRRWTRSRAGWRRVRFGQVWTSCARSSTWTSRLLLKPCRTSLPSGTHTH